jgi:hypothetical protein
LLSCFLSRFFFSDPPGAFPLNHERSTYVSRVLEFRALLAAGDPFPQWAVDFRGGLDFPTISLMRVVLPPGSGLLALSVTTTPGRRTGAIVSALPLAALLVATAFGRPHPE